MNESKPDWKYETYVDLCNEAIEVIEKAPTPEASLDVVTTVAFSIIDSANADLTWKKNLAKHIHENLLDALHFAEEERSKEKVILHA